MGLHFYSSPDRRRDLLCQNHIDTQHSEFVLFVLLSKSLNVNHRLDTFTFTFVVCTISSVVFQLYAWPLLQTLFSEVLTRDEWLKLFDNVFSNHPAYLLMVTVAYSICNRCPLLKCTEIDDFKVRSTHNILIMQKPSNRIQLLNV